MQYGSREDAKLIRYCEYLDTICEHLDWYIKNEELQYKCLSNRYCEGHPRICGGLYEFSKVFGIQK